ncbi:Maf family protein [Kangiella sediminilitoris]|uniref:dTTP/UTP pyrophosphatase n=1 Tax=Kangiella sediminilitoris TaxID=1144748 RepID=A0A1B3BCM0_9GAMM|nr:nucleoside triphosphate pyrophosphatase [Kangiella sediminilitoris]AOE50515.1 Maf-like protein [Kangiella sediminilitoris]
MAAEYSTIYLASGSPRRQEILQQLGVTFQQIANHFDETLLPGESPREYVSRVALGKAMSALEGDEYQKQWPVLTADTTVVHNNEALGKPQDLEHATELLQRLSGNTHTVISSVVIATPQQHWQSTVETEVVFAPLDTQLIERYCQSKEPLGKAGGYAIQGLGGSLVESIRGSYSNVVGLPIYQTRLLLEDVGIQFALR